jgi:hypothetical protein
VAYLHEVPDTINGDIPADYDVSHRAKICPTCRAPTIRRPTRIYHLDSILTPLGMPHSVGMIAETLDAEDPWFNLFPVERSSYKITDGGPGYRILRCSECMGELDGHGCDRCQIDYSDSEGGGEVDIEASEEGDSEGGSEGIFEVSEEGDSEGDDDHDGQAVDLDLLAFGGLGADHLAPDWHAQYQMAAAQAELNQHIRAGIVGVYQQFSANRLLLQSLTGGSILPVYQQFSANRLLLQSLMGGSILPGSGRLGLRAGRGQAGADGELDSEGDQAEDESDGEAEATKEGSDGEYIQSDDASDENRDTVSLPMQPEGAERTCPKLIARIHRTARRTPKSRRQPDPVNVTTSDR